jgi:hypothetical protein
MVMKIAAVGVGDLVARLHLSAAARQAAKIACPTVIFRGAVSAWPKSGDSRSSAATCLVRKMGRAAGKPRKCSN